MNGDNIIIPYCIWHYIEPETNTFLGYISGPRKYKKDGVIGFDCDKDEKIDKKWFLAGTFYAVSPSFRPVPVGMKIFCAKKNIKFPYNTTDMYLMYDPYNIKEDCVYFITYNQYVSNTIPLYFHLINENVFPSFDPKPPSSSELWSQTHISPIYVMKTMHHSFKCVNGRCIPWVSDIPLLYEFDPRKELNPLQNCVIFCNDLISSKDQNKPFNILEIADKEKLKSKMLSTAKTSTKPVLKSNIIIAIIIFLVFIGILIIIFAIYKRKTNRAL